MLQDGLLNMMMVEQYFVEHEAVSEFQEIEPFAQFPDPSLRHSDGLETLLELKA